jgi:hypothetical protein
VIFWCHLKTFAGRRKDIFCEKPVAIDLAVIDRALVAVKRAGVKPRWDSTRGSMRTTPRSRKSHDRTRVPGEPAKAPKISVSGSAADPQYRA